VELSEAQDDLTLTWRFEDDPVRYSVRMKTEASDAALIEARINNRGDKAVAQFTPGFCLQIGGAYAPKTFAYTIIPQQGSAFRLDYGHPFEPRPPLWPGIGWVRALYTGSASYAKRLEQGKSYKPSRPSYIRETGDFPLLARRIPGRDAWIAWIWPNATGYFGNTQTPCMHMDPIVPACPPQETRSIFGRLLFFEGSWQGLYERAKKERAALGKMRDEG